MPEACNLLYTCCGILRVKVDNKLNCLSLLRVQLQVLVDANNLVRECHVVHGQGVVEGIRGVDVYEVRVVIAIEINAVWRGGSIRFFLANVLANLMKSPCK